MMDRFEHIDDVFQKGLEDFKPSPDDGAWENISHRLKENSRKHRLMFMSRAAAIFAFVVTIISGYFLSQQIQTDNQLISTETAPTIENLQHPDEKAVTNNVAITDNQTNNQDANSTEHSAQAIPTQSSGSTDTQPDINTTEGNETVSENSLAYMAGNEAMSAIHDAENMPENDGSDILPLDRLVNRTHYLLEHNNKQLDKSVTGIRSKNQASTTHSQTAEENYLDPIAIAVNEQRNDKMRFQLAGVATPLYTSVESKSNVADQLSAFTSSDIQDPEINKNTLSAYTAGVKVSMGKGKRLSFQTGIMYAKVDQLRQYEAIERITISEGNNSRNSSDQIINPNSGAARPQIGFEMGSSVDTEESSESENAIFDQYVQTITDDIEYLEIPVSMRYTVIDRKLDINLLGGLATNFLISGERNTSTRSGIERTSNIARDLERVKYSTHLGIGFEYPIYKELVFVLEPTMKYYMNSLESIQQTKANPFAFGLYTGVNFAF